MYYTIKGHIQTRLFIVPVRMDVCIYVQNNSKPYLNPLISRRLNTINNVTAEPAI